MINWKIRIFSIFSFFMTFLRWFWRGQWIFSSSKLDYQHSGLTNSSPRPNYLEKITKNQKIKNLSIFQYVKLSYCLGFSNLRGYLKNCKNGCGKTFCGFWDFWCLFWWRDIFFSKFSDSTKKIWRVWWFFGKVAAFEGPQLSRYWTI